MQAKSQNLIAAFAPFAHLAVSPDGRNLHPLAPTDSNSSPLITQDCKTPADVTRKLLETLRRAGDSLTAALDYPILEQRAVTLYKESAQHEHAIHKATFTAQVTLQALRSAHEKAASSNHFHASSYGLAVPLLRSKLSTFIISSLEEWASAAELESYIDESHDTSDPIPFPSLAGSSLPTENLKGKKIVLSLTKDELLVDLEFEKHPYAEDKRIDLTHNAHIIPITLQHVKIHNGDKEDTANAQLGSIHQLLEEKIRVFLKAVVCDNGETWSQLDARVAEKAASELQGILRELKWVTDTVKQEEEGSPGRGLAWWEGIPAMARKSMETLKNQASALDPALDTLLLRFGALPLAYLNSLSLSFLFYLPPLAYLTLLRANSQDEEQISNTIGNIPISRIRKLLLDTAMCDRLYIPLATLSYEPTQEPAPKSSLPASDFSMTDATAEHSTSAGDELLVRSIVPQKGGWNLVFSNSSSGEPIILSQSRMRRVVAAINHPSVRRNGIDGLDILSLTSPPTVGPSWLDLVLRTHHTDVAKVYTSRYRPPPSSNGDKEDGPELLNTLMPLVEPGLSLGTIPVRTMEEVRKVIGIVKEQAWLNSLLKDAGFLPGYQAEDVGHSSSAVGQAPSGEEAKAMYDALMSATYVPSRLRVTYEVLTGGRTGVEARFPWKGTSVTVEVVLDAECERGIRVNVDGERREGLEEVARRGGLLAVVTAARSMRMKG